MNYSNKSEKSIEQKLTLTVKKCGGICPKFVSPGFDGMPDRLVLLPFGKIAFVEVKAPNKKAERMRKVILCHCVKAVTIKFTLKSVTDK